MLPDDPVYSKEKSQVLILMCNLPPLNVGSELTLEYNKTWCRFTMKKIDPQATLYPSAQVGDLLKEMKP